MKCRISIALTGENKPLILESETAGKVDILFGDTKITCDAEELWDALQRVTQYPQMEAQTFYPTHLRRPRGIIGAGG